MQARYTVETGSFRYQVDVLENGKWREFDRYITLAAAKRDCKKRGITLEKAK
jgi:hypothetical protein